ncbi:hypothetical protein AB0E59_32580 [Lentzea sp. NPDC034063]|uniref:hypothetical protein n=1 Tax=unclassified Lentzea TaxID=2643253 RepID=UPI0033F85EAF
MITTRRSGLKAGPLNQRTTGGRPHRRPNCGRGEEREVLRRYTAALERADDNALTSRPARAVTRPSRPLAGRSSRSGCPICVRFEVRPAATNLQPMAASCILPGDRHRSVALTVLRVEDGLVAETATFGTALSRAFGLPEAL